MERGGSFSEKVTDIARHAPRLRRSLSSLLAQVRVVRYPIALSLCTTVITFAFGICGTLAFEKKIPSESWLASWQRWDAPSFLDIAQHGYPHDGSREHLAVLLPVYPFAIRLSHFLIRNWHAAAVVLSNLCFAAVLAYLFLLVRLEYEAGVARRAVLFCAIFPTAYFLHAAYSESMFLLFTIAAFYHARRGQWLICGILGMLATGTRLPGAAVLPALVLEYLHQRDFRWRAIRWDAAALALVPLGALAYLWINYRCFGDPLYFLAAQKQVWGAFLRWPFPSVRGNWYGVLHASADERVIQYGGPLLAFMIMMAALLAAPIVLRPSYALYLALSWVMIFFNNFPISSPRYILAVFPLFILLGRAANRAWLRDSLAFLSSLLYAICIIHFVRGWWAF
jgi:Mannosyltransferase (PIG-V)